MLAETGIFVVIAQATGLANAGDQLRRTARQLERDDAGGDSDDSIPKNHEDAGKKASRDGVRRDVSVADRRDGNDGPIHAGGDAGEAVLLPFDLIHQGANNDHDRENNKQEHNDFP